MKNQQTVKLPARLIFAESLNQQLFGKRSVRAFTERKKCENQWRFCHGLKDNIYIQQFHGYEIC